MSFKDFYALLNEKKDHIINKIPSLSAEQKKQLIDFFAKKPNLESKINWNKWKDLSFSDFEPVMVPTKTEIKKKVHAAGIKGLKEGEDYRIFPFHSDKVVGYVPLNWEASKHIASDSIGGCEGKWCTAYQKTDSYWRDYVIGEKGALVYFIIQGIPGEDDTKYAMVVFPNGAAQVYDADDHSISADFFIKDILNSTPSIVIAANRDFFNEVREYIKENTPPAELTEEQLDELARDYAEYVDSKFRGNEKAIAEARSIIDSEYENITNYSYEEGMTAESMRGHIESRFDDWNYGYERIIKFMRKKHSIDPDNTQNKINALAYSEYASEEDPEYASDLRERLLDMEWVRLYDEPFDALITRLDEENIKGFDDLDTNYLSQWLAHNYENNYDEFVEFKENFVDEFNGILRTKLTDDEIAYIRELVDKAEKTGYAKEPSQTALKLDNVNRYLNRVLA
ncbi:MAG: hypothetical protein HQK96_17775 [Nitrospirae bacterium]|nr:hypothetical protein [Nitrospirota bacterium]